jgi:hypothetical protein
MRFVEKIKKKLFDQKEITENFYYYNTHIYI